MEEYDHYQSVLGDSRVAAEFRFEISPSREGLLSIKKPNTILFSTKKCRITDSETAAHIVLRFATERRHQHVDVYPGRAGAEQELVVSWGPQPYTAGIHSTLNIMCCLGVLTQVQPSAQSCKTTAFHLFH